MIPFYNTCFKFHSRADIYIYIYIYIYKPNIFDTFVDQVKLLTLSYCWFEANRHKSHCKDPFKEHLVKGLKAIAPEVFKLQTLCATDKGK